MLKQSSDSQSNERQQDEQVVSANPKYIVEHNFPTAPPQLRIVLRGLLLFAFAGRTQCEVGAVRVLPPYETILRHNFQVRVWDDTTPPCHKFQPFPLNVPFNRLDIAVNGPALYNGVYVYQQDPFTKIAPPSDPRDFRFVPDFEGDDFYGPTLTPQQSTLAKNPQVMAPRVYIHNGLFYTWRNTKTIFEATPDNGAPNNFLGQMADIVAVNIYLNAGGTAQLFRDGNPVLPSPINSNSHFQVDILNNCDRGSATACHHVPESPDKRERNDFFFTTQPSSYRRINPSTC